MCVDETIRRKLDSYLDVRLPVSLSVFDLSTNGAPEKCVLSIPFSAIDAPVLNVFVCTCAWKRIFANDREFSVVVQHIEREEIASPALL